jgi:hypothetical protein
MLASDFVDRKEKLLKAVVRGIISREVCVLELFKLFVQAQVSRADDEQVANEMINKALAA